MATYFAYKALTLTGDMVSGEVLTETMASLDEVLKQKQLTLVSAKPRKKLSARSLSRRELAAVFLKLSMLLEAGQTLHKALLTAQEACPKKAIRSLLQHIRAQLEQGQDLLTIAQAYPTIFPPLMRQYIQLGQKSGNLVDAFKRMSETLHRELEKTQNLRKMTAYPLLLLGMMTTMMGLFMEFLLPQLVEHLQTIGAKELPFLSRSLIAFAGFMAGYRWLILGFLGLLLLCMGLYPVSSFMQRRLTPLFLKLPVLGYFLRQHYGQKWLLMVGELYQAGVDFKTCLVEAEKGESNPFIQQQWHHMATAILEGHPLDKLMMQTHLFSPVSISLCEMALHNGTLAESLLKAHAIEFKDTQHRMEMLIKSLEPGLLILMGMMLLWIVLAVISPLYDFMPG